MATKITDQDVLEQIACAVGRGPQELWLENNHVWSRTEQDGLRAHCTRGTPFWHEQSSLALTRRLMLNLMR